MTTLLEKIQSTDGLTPAKLLPICNHIYTNFHHREFAEVNTVLEQLDFTLLSDQLCVSVVRFCWCERDNLPALRGAIQRSYDALKQRGADADNHLRGLL